MRTFTLLVLSCRGSKQVYVIGLYRDKKDIGSSKVDNNERQFSSSPHIEDWKITYLLLFKIHLDLGEKFAPKLL